MSNFNWTAYGNWENRKEWEQERGELEINREETLTEDCPCDLQRCANLAFTAYEIKRVEDHYGKWIHLCADHSHPDNAFELFWEID